MALLTVPSASRGSAMTFVLDKAALMALPVVASDSWFSVSDNLKQVVFEYRSAQGRQIKLITFNWSQAQPSADVVFSARARDAFELVRIKLIDQENDELELKGSQLPVGLGITFVGQGDNGGGSAGGGGAGGGVPAGNQVLFGMVAMLEGETLDYSAQSWTDSLGGRSFVATQSFNGGWSSTGMVVPAFFGSRPALKLSQGMTFKEQNSGGYFAIDTDTINTTIIVVGAASGNADFVDASQGGFQGVSISVSEYGYQGAQLPSASVIGRSYGVQGAYQISLTPHAPYQSESKVVAAMTCNLAYPVSNELWVNGVKATGIQGIGSDAGLQVNTNLQLSLGGYSGTFMDTYIGGLFVYNRLLSETEIQDMSHWLMNRYSIV